MKMNGYAKKGMTLKFKMSMHVVGMQVRNENKSVASSI